MRDVAQSDPAALFIGRDHITLDEIQRQPELLLAIKADVDRHRQPGRFLLTGSANLLLMKQVADTLAGRAVYFSLPPLTWAEIEERGYGRTLDLLLEQETLEQVARALPSSVPAPDRPLEEAVWAGGYPVPALAEDAGFRARWFDGYVQTYLERDLRQLSAIDQLMEFRRLMQLSAVHNGRLLNIASLAGDAGLAAATAPVVALLRLPQLELSVFSSAQPRTPASLPQTLPASLQPEASCAYILVFLKCRFKFARYDSAPDP